MATHHRTHSLPSSTGSLSDDLALFSSSTPAPLYGHAAADGYTYDAQGDTSVDASEAGDSPYLGGSGAGGATSGTGGASTAGGESGSRRSRARAFSFLSTHHGQAGQSYGARGLDGPSPATGETPFVGGAYDYALDAEETLTDEEDEDDLVATAGGRDGGEAMEMRSPGLGGGGGRAYRARFQPLVGVELAVMGVSAAAVLGLTVGAVVLAFVG
ncbi:hypothetical protein JCM8097_006130 [Rhodosporidiobolus ruineniae]